MVGCGWTSAETKHNLSTTKYSHILYNICFSFRMPRAYQIRVLLLLNLPRSPRGKIIPHFKLGDRGQEKQDDLLKITLQTRERGRIWDFWDWSCMSVKLLPFPLCCLILWRSKLLMLWSLEWLMRQVTLYLLSRSREGKLSPLASLLPLNKKGCFLLELQISLTLGEVKIVPLDKGKMHFTSQAER